MKILVRLPNWLGDVVMASGFLQQLPRFFPGAEVDVIIKKGLEDLLSFLPPVRRSYIFSKEEQKGLGGLWRYGRRLGKAERYDLFFSLPDSFSSAFIGYATGARQRIGYRKEARHILFTRGFKKPAGLHRVHEYIYLLERFTGRAAEGVEVRLAHDRPGQDYLVININSEASSRRLTQAKAVSVVNRVRAAVTLPIYLVGAPKEAPFVEAVLNEVLNPQGITSLAGKTDLKELVNLLAGARLLLSTDSGPAHLANAAGTPTIVLFGAGNENNTAPYHREQLTVMRLGKLSCEPCVKNVCMQFTEPQCLELLPAYDIARAVTKIVD